MKTLKQILLCIIICFLIGGANYSLANNDTIRENEYAKLEKSLDDTLPVEIKTESGETLLLKLNVDKPDISEKGQVDISIPFFLHLLIDLITVLIIVFFIYYPNNRRQEYILFCAMQHPSLDFHF